MTLTSVGLKTTGLQGPQLSNFKTEERVSSQQQRYQWSMDEGAYMNQP